MTTTPPTNGSDGSDGFGGSDATAELGTAELAAAGDGQLAVAGSLETDQALVVDGVDFAYGQLQVLFGVSLDVYRGEALALLGTNGAGKSTLLRVIAGLETPSAGSVTFAGRDITGVPAARLVAEGMVLIPGGRCVFTDMTVEENLEMQALRIRRQRALVRQRTELVLATFPRLAERLSQPAGRLSGGE